MLSDSLTCQGTSFGSFASFPTNTDPSNEPNGDDNDANVHQLWIMVVEEKMGTTNEDAEETREVWECLPFTAIRRPDCILTQMTHIRRSGRWFRPLPSPLHQPPQFLSTEQCRELLHQVRNYPSDELSKAEVHQQNTLRGRNYSRHTTSSTRS